jgi:hypothetical protein
MEFDFVRSLALVKVVPFTVGDLVEGLAFLEPVERRAVLFGLEQKLPIDTVIDMTHARAARLNLTPIADAAIKQCPRHIRLHYIFWGQLQDGLIAPLLDLERQVTGAFGGMTWDDLSVAYSNMLWVDHDHDAEHFLMLARQQGVLKP